MRLALYAGMIFVSFHKIEMFFLVFKHFNYLLHRHSEQMSSTVASVVATVRVQNKYRTYHIRSWHAYQQITPSHLHSIEHYNADCKEYAKLYEEDVMVLRDHVTKNTGIHWCSGWAAQNCADTNGYVDVRTEKKYTLDGETSFFKEIGRV